MTTLTFQMANRLDAVDPMVLTLRRQVEGRLADETQFRFSVCVSEALTNLVLHAETPQKDAPIQITLALSDHEAVVDLFDPTGAKAFDLRENSPSLSEVDAMAESGRGLGLILECADQVHYGAVDQRNRLSLTFHSRG